MPSIASHQSDNVVKMLLLGESGAGKTGALASLAVAGYRLFIADFDNGLDILKDPAVLDPQHHEKVFFKTFYDKNTLMAGKMLPQASGFAEFTTAMGDWKEDGKSMGSIYSWGAQDVFVIDSLTLMGNAIMNQVLQLSGKPGQKPSLPDFGNAVDTQEAVIETIYNPAVRCNIVVTAHLQRQGDDASGGAQKAFPSALGKKLPPKIGRYFNSTVLIKKTGMGAKVTRELHTSATHDTDLKVSKPSIVPAVMEADLGKLFKLLTQSKG